MIEWLYAGLFVIAAVVGVRSSLHLTRRYRSVRGQLESRDALLLLAFVLVAWTLTVAALWWGFVSVRRIVGFEPLDWTPFVSVVLAAVVLFIPAYLDAIVGRVAKVPE